MIALALIVACGGALVGPPSVAWKDMTHDQRARYMAKVVVPKMKPIFQELDPKQFAEFDCKTCHGDGAKNHSFKMPNPKIFVLPGDRAGFDALAKDKPRWTQFMEQRVVPEMTKLLDRPEFNSEHPDPNALGCYTCHTHKEPGPT